MVALWQVQSFSPRRLAGYWWVVRAVCWGDCFHGGVWCVCNLRWWQESQVTWWQWCLVIRGIPQGTLACLLCCLAWVGLNGDFKWKVGKCCIVDVRPWMRHRQSRLSCLPLALSKWTQVFRGKQVSLCILIWYGTFRKKWKKYSDHVFLDGLLCSILTWPISLFLLPAWIDQTVSWTKEQYGGRKEKKTKLKLNLGSLYLSCLKPRNTVRWSNCC